MKIDFHTRYNPKTFEGLCTKAIRLGLDALVMSGLPDNHERKYKSLTFFPAQEVEWVAAMEMPSYKSRKDWIANEKEKDQPIVYRGKALVILPSGRYIGEEARLFELLEYVRKRGGISVSLHDDTNFPVIVSFEDGNPVYEFDAVMIRPYNMGDIHSLLTQPGRVCVAGSNAEDEKGIGVGKAYCEYHTPIHNQSELIELVKIGTKPELKVFGEMLSSPIRIEQTAKPLTIDESSIKCFVKGILSK